MAFGDVVQAVETSTSSTGDIPVSFAPAVAGNLLIYAVGSTNQQTWGVDPAGWTPLTGVPNGSGAMSGKWFWKIAAGGENSVTLTFTPTTTNPRGVVVEFAGPFKASPFDAWNDDQTNISTVVTSQSTGTSQATSQADELAVAFIAGDTVVNLNGTPLWSNGFTSVILPTTNTGRALVTIARKVLSATGTVETTYSVTDTGDEAYGAIATFMKQTAALQASFPGGSPYAGHQQYAEHVSYIGGNHPLDDLTTTATAVVTPPIGRVFAELTLDGLTTTATAQGPLKAEADLTLEGLTTVGHLAEPPSASEVRPADLLRPTLVRPSLTRNPARWV